MSAARVVVITGASAGVGRGIALACGAAGWRVWIAARRATSHLEKRAARFARIGGER